MDCHRWMWPFLVTIGHSQKCFYNMVQLRGINVSILVFSYIFFLCKLFFFPIFSSIMNRFDGVFITLLFFLCFVLVKSTDSLGNHLNNLLREAENRIQELSGIEDTPQAPFSTRASFSSIIGKFRHDLLVFYHLFFFFFVAQSLSLHLLVKDIFNSPLFIFSSSRCCSTYFVFNLI